MSRTLRTRVALGMVMASFTLLSAGLPGYILPVSAQSTPELKKMNLQFVTEAGCPVEVTSANTELEVDPFGQPIAARHYIDWSNSTGQPIVAVKFRIGYVLDDGSLQTMAAAWPMASGATPQGPGQQVSYKWRGERVDARTRSVKLRVMQVRFADGSEWMSDKLKSQSAPSSSSAASQGFQPLQADQPGLDQIADRMPGTPVPLTDTGRTYTSFPERTQTGSVPFQAVPGGTPSAGYQDNAFGGGAPMSATPAGTPQFGAAPAGAPGAWTAPAASAPATPAATPAAAAPATPGWAAGPAPAAAAPAAVTPATTYTPPPKAPTASDITDPLGTIDSLLGNTSKPTLPNTIVPAPAAPAAAPAAAPVAAPVAAPADNGSAPAATAAPATAPTAPAAPVTSAPTSDNASGSASSGGAPPATPAPADDFAN